MNKLTRFTLFAGLLAIGLSACGDDVQVVQPEPPPPDPLVVSLEPASVVLMRGETITLAVNISGGATGESPSISCTTASTHLTVSTSGQTCSVTAKDEDASDDTNNSVTVSVTVGEQTATAGASVVIPPDTSVPATVVIQNVTQGSLGTPVALNNVARQIEVTVNIDPGTQILQKVTLLYRGNEIASQTLTPAQVAEIRAAISSDSPEAAVLRTITFSWETDAYVIDAGGGAITGSAVAIPNHLNGTGALQARLDVDDGTAQGTAVNSDPLNLTLRNLNGFHLKIDRTGSTNTALDVQQFEWRGGVDGAANTDAGVNGNLIPVIYTPGVTLASAQFTFAGILRTLGAGPWTYIWTPAALANYTMPPAGTAAFPNMLRDGEYPRVVGNGVLSDGQGMGPFGGALDCTGSAVVPGAPTGILNVEVSGTLLCPGGTAWSPPSASLVASANQILDPLRVGERIDNVGPAAVTYALNSRPGLPNWPQLPATPAGGALVASAGTWVNEVIDFSQAGIYGGPGADAGVSRVVAGFPAPTFLPAIFETSSNGGATWGAFGGNGDPTGANLGPETVTNNVYRVRVTDRDELNNQTVQNLTGNAGSVLLGLDAVDPFLQHTAGLSNPDRDAFDLATPWAGSGTVLVAGDDDLTVSAYNYYVNWTDPVNVGASGFTAFAGNPVWRQIHRVTPAGVTAVVGGVTGSTAVTPAWSGAGLTNYGRTAASQQAVTGLSVVNGYYIYRAYVLDDAGNASVDANCTPNCGQPQGGTVTYNSSAIRRQAIVDGPAATGQPTVFGVTAPVNMVGGSTVTFISNSSDNQDLGQSILSLDYAPFATAGSTFWTANTTGADAQLATGYFTPAATLAPTQGTTGGIRFPGAENEEGVIFDSPFEAVATLQTAAQLTRSVTKFVRSIEMVCSGAGTPIASCPAAPADWGPDIAAQLVNTPGAVGWFAPAGAPVNTAYAAGRPIAAAFTQYDGTRFDHKPATSGNINYNLEQIGATNATSAFPHRSVSVAAINPVSVALNAPGGVVTSVYHTGGLQVGWAIKSVSATYSAPTVTNRPVGAAAAAVPGGAGGRTLNVSVTARLITGSSTVVGGPGQNLFPGPLGEVQFYALEQATGTLRYIGMQNNPVVFENNPACATNTMATQANYRCWDFTTSGTIQNFVGANDPVQILAIGINAAGDGLVTFPVDGT